MSTEDDPPIEGQERAVAVTVWEQTVSQVMRNRLQVTVLPSRSAWTVRMDDRLQRRGAMIREFMDAEIELNRRVAQHLGRPKIRVIHDPALAPVPEESCAICFEPVRTVVSTSCGHRFCPCLANYYASCGGPTCPLCRATVSLLVCGGNRDDCARTFHAGVYVLASRRNDPEN